MKTLSLLATDKNVKGENLTCHYGWLKSVWGEAFIVFNELGLIFLGFPKSNDESAVIIEALQRQWPLAQWQSTAKIPELYRQIFVGSNDLTIVLKGTAFQLAVWQALLDIPLGETLSYSALANKIARPKAWRAVGSAVGKNPISYLVPCHRVLPVSGICGQYLWGTALKQQLLKSEGIKISHIVCS